MIPEEASSQRAPTAREATRRMRQLYRRYGYEEVVTPQIFDMELFHTSGHYEHYKENMFFTESEDRTFAVKPMNCPGHCLIYDHGIKSYRDLPLVAGRAAPALGR